MSCHAPTGGRQQGIMTFTRRTFGLVLSELAGIGALTIFLFYLPLFGPSAGSDLLAPNRIAAYLLLFAAPLFIFLPFCITLRLRPVWLLAAGSWALLGYVLLFVGPPRREEATFMTYTAFLSLVFVALASALSVPMGATSRHLLPPATSVRGMARALRQGSLLSLFAVILLAMSPLGVLNWLNTLLVFTIVALTEFFFLARD